MDRLVKNLDEPLPTRPMKRREALKVLFGMGLGLSAVAARGTPDGNEKYTPPQENDLFVFAFGDREGEVVAPEDVALRARQIIAYPMDPETEEVRNGSRLNQVLLVRVDPASLYESTRARAVDGIVAYSAVCTHTGCDITDWADETSRFQCPCHESEFDPSDGARVIGGPAPRRLATLPLKLVDGALMAAGGFLGPVGYQQSGTS